MTVFVTEELAGILYDFGYALVESDKRDIGKLGGGHTFIHHYQCGAILMVLGGLGKTIAKVRNECLDRIKTRGA